MAKSTSSIRTSLTISCDVARDQRLDHAGERPGVVEASRVDVAA